MTWQSTYSYTHFEPCHYIVVKCQLHALTALLVERSRGNPQDGSLGGPHSRSWRFGNEKHFLPLPGTEPLFFDLKPLVYSCPLPVYHYECRISKHVQTFPIQILA